MLVDRINKETTDISRVIVDLSPFLDAAETVTSIVSATVSLGTSGWAVVPYPPMYANPPYDPTPLLFQSYTLDSTSRYIIMYVSFGTPGNVYTCQFVFLGTSNRRTTIEVGVQIMGIPPEMPPGYPVNPYQKGSAIVYIGVAPPEAPWQPALPGMLWWDDEDGDLYIYYDDGTSFQWVPASANLGKIYGAVATIATTPPSQVTPGMMWWDSIGGELYIWFDDGNSQQWVAASNYAAALNGQFLALGGGTMVGSLYWTSTGSTISRAAQDRSAEVVNVKDYGAVGDGVTDDTAAINAALSACLAIYAAGKAWTLKFPCANYVVTGPLNLTNFRLQVQGGNIDGQGSLIIAKMVGGIVLDCTGSRWMHIHDLNIQGDGTAIPKIGIQIGPASIVADYIKLTKVNIFGSFSLAAFYNKGSEMFSASGCYMANNVTAANAFVAVEDGVNHWNATSTFTSITQPVETSATNKGHTWIDCAFQGVGSSGVIWLGHVEQYRMIGSYASNTVAGTHIFTLYGINDGSPAVTSCSIDCHCETTALASVFLLTGGAGRTNLYINELAFRDHECSAQSYIFAIDPASSVNLVTMVETDLSVIPYSSSAVLTDKPWEYIIYAKRLALTPNYFQTGFYYLNGPYADLANGGVTQVGPISQGLVMTPSQFQSGGYAPVSSQGAYLAWNRGGNGSTHLLTNRGGGNTGGVVFEDVTSSDVTTWLATISQVGVYLGFAVYCTSDLQVQGYRGTYSTAGAYLAWNRGGDGTAWLIANQGGGSTGGFNFADATSSNVVTSRLYVGPTGIYFGSGVPVHFAASTSLGFNGTAPIAKPTVTGSKGANAALTSLMAALSAYGLVTDSTT